MGPKSKSGAKCASCNTKIGGNEPFVEALKKKYHKACFNCVNCSKPIEGDFHPVNDQPWCNDCYLETQAPKCADCGKPITGTIMKTDDGRTFHENCSKNLTQGTCSACRKTIGFTDPTVEALGNKYHQDCFRCAHCQGSVPQKFHAEDGRPWCDNCYNQKLEATSPRCHECKEAITKGARLSVAGMMFHEACFPNAGWGPCGACNKKILLNEPSVRVAALNQHWHPGCLSCPSCEREIRSEFVLHGPERRVACWDCHLVNSPPCGYCQQPVLGPQTVKALNNRFWHPECFVCTACQQMLHLLGNQYYNVEGKPYCRNDVDKLGIPVVG